VVQETFLALWNRAELFDAKVGSLAAWLHTIARNRTVDRLRAAGRRPNLIPLSAASGEDEGDGAALDRLVSTGTVLGGAMIGLGPEGELAASELQAVLRGALAELPEAERTAIVLAYSEELTQTEIAERLGWPLGTVKTRTRRALLRLRDALGDDLGPGAAPAPIPIRIGDRSE
jgi:RNA polymerase sigma-70 factor (ECF subfamily)